MGRGDELKCFYDNIYFEEKVWSFLINKRDFISVYGDVYLRKELEKELIEIDYFIIGNNKNICVMLVGGLGFFEIPKFQENLKLFPIILNIYGIRDCRKYLKQKLSDYFNPEDLSDCKIKLDIGGCEFYNYSKDQTVNNFSSTYMFLESSKNYTMNFIGCLNEVKEI